MSRRVNKMNSKCNILILNEDCMMKIFSYLSLQELVRSERVSKKWKYFVEQKYKSFTEFNNDLFKCQDFDVINRLLKKIGPNLRTLYIDQRALLACHEKHLNSTLISQFCPNLLELRIQNVHHTRWRSAMKKFKKLKVLEFTNCGSVIDDTFEFCSNQLEELIINKANRSIWLTHVNVVNLKKLCIKDVPIRESSMLKKLKEANKLKQLFLSNLHVNDAFIKEVLKSLPNLTHLGFNYLPLENSIYEISKLKHLESLQLTSMYELQDDMIRSICRSCTQLVSLDISIKYELEYLTNSSLEYICNLKHLEELNVSGHIITGAPFMKLGHSGNGSKLRVLICKSIEITNEVVLHIFLNCPQFEKIDLYNCIHIDSTLIEQIIVISHMKGCQTNRYFVNLPEQYPVENDCSCIKISHVDSQ